MALAAGNLEGRKGYEVHARTIVGACSKVQRKQREEEREEMEEVREEEEERAPRSRQGQLKGECQNGR